MILGRSEGLMIVCHVHGARVVLGLHRIEATWSASTTPTCNLIALQKRHLKIKSHGLDMLCGRSGKMLNLIDTLFELCSLMWRPAFDFTQAWIHLTIEQASYENMPVHLRTMK